MDARLLQGTQGVCTTDVRVHHLTKAARLPRDHSAPHYIAKLPKNAGKYMTTKNCSGRMSALWVLYNMALSCDSFANLQDYLRQPCM